MSVEEEEEVKSETKIQEINQPKCDLQCLHHGDSVCYNDEAAKEIIKKIPEDSIHSSSSASIEDDSLHSGESFFKSFSFEADKDDPDVEKCMAFWKSILAKNVKPIKCNLLKTKEKQTKSEKVKESVKTEKVKENPCDRKEVDDVWLSIYQDLQRRKLDKIKLVKSKKCEPCADYTDDEIEKKQFVEDIRNLNDWQPHAQPSHSGKIDVKSQVRRTLQVLKAVRVSQADVHNTTPRKSSSDVHRTTPKKSSSIKEARKGNSSHKTRNKSDIQTTDVHETLPDKSKIQEKAAELETQERQSGDAGQDTQDSGTCFKCGCDVEDCICAEIGDCLGHISKPDETKFGPCFPCDCLTECICGDHMAVNKTICSCGCRLEECICANLESCTCGCGVKECTCKDLEKNVACSCGCGVDDCMCQQLFTKSCKCGHSDCDCDMIKTLNAYLETLEPPVDFRRIKVVSKEAQTEGEKVADVEAQPAHYCIICGHFNCHCDESQ